MDKGFRVRVADLEVYRCTRVYKLFRVQITSRPNLSRPGKHLSNVATSGVSSPPHRRRRGHGPRSLVLTAVRQNGGAFAYAEPALRGDRGICGEERRKGEDKGGNCFRENWCEDETELNAGPFRGETSEQQHKAICSRRPYVRACELLSHYATLAGTTRSSKL